MIFTLILIIYYGNLKNLGWKQQHETWPWKILAQVIVQTTNKNVISFVNIWKKYNINNSSIDIIVM